LKCLEKEPQARYASAALLADDVGRYLNGEPILARPAPRWERAWKWARRRPAAAALAVVSTLSILVALGGGSWFQANVNRQREAGRRRLEAVRTQGNWLVLLGEEAMRRQDWVSSKARMSSALALIRAEPHLAAMGDRVSRRLSQSEQKITAQKNGEFAQAQFAAFERAYDEAVFYQSQYTGLDPEANLRASRASARLGLKQFDPKSAPDTGLSLPPNGLDTAEEDLITAHYYELALILAESVAQSIGTENPTAQAQEALRTLERIERVRAPTKAFYLRRAAYLKRAGGEAEHALIAAAAAAADSTVDDFVGGEQAYRQRDYRGAIQAFRRLLARQPDHFWGQYLLAICLLKEHRPAEAHAALLACQARRPGFVSTYLLKGFAEGETGEFDLAEDDLRRAADLGLDAAARYVMLVNRGVMRVRRERNAAAAEDFCAAIELRPNQFQAYVDLAQSYEHQNRFAEALDRGIARAPGQAVLYRTRARVHRLQSHDQEALADLDRAIALTPPGDSALVGDHLERALFHQRAGRYSDALTECDRALAVRPGSGRSTRSEGRRS